MPETVMMKTRKVKVEMTTMMTMEKTTMMKMTMKKKRSKKIQLPKKHHILVVNMVMVK
jgi:hypothetical protein